MSHFNFSIKNCTSIDFASIKVKKNTLNIKYGHNGLGKSSIARAIYSAVKNDGALEDLKPFKYRGIEENNPEVLGHESIRSILLFDERYVTQFAFQRDEVLKNSFDIFIKNDVYSSGIENINSLLSGLKQYFHNNQNITSIIIDLNNLKESLATTAKGRISKSSKIYKAYGQGNKIENIPTELKSYEDFLKSENPSSWIIWQTKGTEFYKNSSKCPFCTNDISNEKEKIELVKNTYDHKSIEHLCLLQNTIERLGDYFSNECKEKLLSITKSSIELSEDEENFLISLIGNINTLINSIERTRSISFFDLKDSDTIEEDIKNLKINIELLPSLKSIATELVINPINDQINSISDKIGILKGEINKNNKRIGTVIQSQQTSINNFLKKAGYKYAVKVESEGDSYKMKLIHNDHHQHIGSASQYLSYGERNAFAIVLFMHQVIKEQPDFVILDDPVSSFDKTKKFAVLDELFKGKDSIKNTTTLLLTHDLEPAIDITISAKGQFQEPKPQASFLNCKNSVIYETEIFKSDIKTFSKICKENISILTNPILKCIYLRRHFEVIDSLNEEYNYLSNLLHGRIKAYKKINSQVLEMTPEEIEKAEVEIKSIFPEFSYRDILNLIKNKTEIINLYKSSSIGYEKLQLFRIITESFEEKLDNSVLQKFMNETFHIENDYIMQLNPHRFDTIPEYIISECDQLINKLEDKISQTEGELQT